MSLVYAEQTHGLWFWKISSKSLYL